MAASSTTNMWLLLLAKSFFSGLITFALKYWRIILPLLILVATLLYINALRGARDDAVTALSDYKAAQTALANQQIAENVIKQATVKSKYDVAEYIKTNAINAITNNKTIKQISNEIRNTYETKPIKPVMVSGAGIVLPKSASSASENGEATSDQQGLAGSESDTNATCAGVRSEKELLELACAATTAYYNQCKASLDADTLLYGREE